MNHQSNSHDGSRVVNSTDTFEWWYFDLDLTNRYHVYIEWHSPIFNYKDSFKTLIVRIYNYENVLSGNNVATKKFKWIKAFRYHHLNVFQSEKACEITFPSGYIKEKDGNYFINILEESFRTNLKLARLLPPLSIKDDILYEKQNGEKYLKWYIPLPRASVIGEIEIGNKFIKAEGLAYHDHNWGNLNLRKYIAGWLWTRIFFKDFMLIFGDIIPHTPEEKTRILLFVDREGHRIDTTSLKVDYDQFNDQNKYRIEIPQIFSIEFGDEERYHIVFRSKRKIMTAEAPLGSFDNHLLNVWLVRTYNLFRLYYAPNRFRKWLGRILYFQSEIIAELHYNHSLRDKQTGKIEVICFAH